MALEPITRKEKIIAGQDLTPITRMEKFLKDFGGGGGGSAPKPLTYDYMPEGYPSKSVETITIMEEQEVTFAAGGGIYRATAPVKIDISDGQTYTIVWDGAEYSCVGHVADGISYIGNPAAFGAESTGEPFLYANANLQSMWVSYDTSTSHTIKVTITDTVYQTIDVNMLPKAGDNYGVVKKSDIVSAYNFPAQVQHDQMVDAIAEFNTGNASIVWGGANVINASYNSSDDTISVTFANEPLKTLTFSNKDGLYNKTLGSATYGELQGGQVRITNDNNVAAVLAVEGESSNKTLKVVAERISIGGPYYGISTTEIILKSSTSGSTKKFKITVDDSGTISATEVT